MTLPETAVPFRKGFRVPAARALLATVFGTLLLGAASPPLLERAGHAAGAATVRRLYAPVCHQIPERSLRIGEAPLAVCQRCSGIYAGLLLGTILPAWALAALCGARRRAWALAGLAPAVADFGVGLAGVWPGSPASRLGSGLLLGTMVATLGVTGLAEAAAAIPGIPRRAIRPSAAPRSTR